MLTMADRDREWAHRAMGSLFVRAAELGMTPMRWELGYFIARDLQSLRDPAYASKRWTRPETVWGCEIQITTFHDSVALVVHGTTADGAGEYHRLIAGDTHDGR